MTNTIFNGVAREDGEALMAFGKEAIPKTTGPEITARAFIRRETFTKPPRDSLGGDDLPASTAQSSLRADAKDLGLWLLDQLDDELPSALVVGEENPGGRQDDYQDQMLARSLFSRSLRSGCLRNLWECRPLADGVYASANGEP